jgi:hypothetical protein
MLKLLDSGAQKFSQLKNTYKGANQNRINAFEELNKEIDDTYLLFKTALATDAMEVLLALSEKIKSIRKKISVDHTTNGTASFLGIFQPKSRALKIIDKALGDINNLDRIEFIGNLPQVTSRCR